MTFLFVSNIPSHSLAHIKSWRCGLIIFFKNQLTCKERKCQQKQGCRRTQVPELFSKEFKMTMINMLKIQH